MKNSNNGKKPDTWEAVKIDVIYQIIGGGTPSTKNIQFWNGSIPWITSADITNDGKIEPRKTVTDKGVLKSATNIVPKGSLVVVTRVGLGKVAIAEHQLCFSQDIQALLLGDELVDNKYAFYYLKQAVQTFKYSGRGTTISGVTKKQLRDLQFLLPPLSEQKRISEKIEELYTKLDKGVESLKQTQLLLKKYRQSVLEKAFRGFLTTMYREKSPYNKNYNYKLSIEIKQYNDTKIGQDIPRRLPPIVLSDLPKLPFGWCWIEAHKICQSVRDGTHDTPKYVEKGIPLVTSKNLKNGAVDISNIQYISEHDYIEIGKRSRVDKDDILYAMIGTIGNPVIVTSENQYSVKNVGIFKTNREFINPSYLKYYLESWFQKRIMESKDLIRGTTQKFVSLGGLRAMPIPYPSVDEQKVIVSEVESRLSIIENTEETIKNNILKAFSLKQSILKHAFEGNLVPQDPNDEPASVLLERIKTEKSKLKN